jgi:hypothetical protein
MTETSSSNDHSPKPPKNKRGRYKIILKSVFLFVSVLWRVYKMLRNAYEFIKEFFG